MLIKIRARSQVIRRWNSTGGISLGLQVTDPLVLYQQRLANESIKPDEAQWRAMLEIEKLYHRIKDYRPVSSLQRRLQDVSKASFADGGNEIWRKAAWYSPERESLALIKRMSDEEELMKLDSRQGIILYGDVGTGKSMLLDILAMSLPTSSKRRDHYSTFMLDIYRRINQLTLQSASSVDNSLQREYCLLRVASDLVEESNILFLDEFQMPDRAAARIVKSVIQYYFQFGGVLALSTNRLPQELYTTDYRREDFGKFLEILQARCVSHDMRSNVDWRRLERESPSNFFVPGGDGKKFSDHRAKATASASFTNVHVYGRNMAIQSAFGTTALCHFDELCKTDLGPADFSSIASKYSTIYLEGVPRLEAGRKDIARRFISLIDALYECRCRLIIQADAPLSELFFSADGINAWQSTPSLEQEMLSEIDLELTSPFRPNVTPYAKSSPEEKVSPLNAKAIEDSVFTGKDEEFSYRRAISRLYELTSDTQRQWQPLPETVRSWERSAEHSPLTPRFLDFNSGRSPSTKSPVFNAWVHAWGFMPWSKATRRKRTRSQPSMSE